MSSKKVSFRNNLEEVYYVKENNIKNISICLYKLRKDICGMITEKNCKYCKYHNKSNKTPYL